MRLFFLLTIFALLAAAPALATVTATGTNAYSITLDQSSIKDAIIDLLTAAKKDYILDPDSQGLDFIGAKGTTATMRITNATFDQALQILTEAGLWTADLRDDGRYVIVWSGEELKPAKVRVTKGSDGQSFVVNVAPATNQATAIREIAAAMGAKVFVDPLAASCMENGKAAGEGSFVANGAEQAIRHVATDPLDVKLGDGGTVIVTCPKQVSGRCSCGQELLKGWRFCPACGKAVGSAEAAK